MRTGCPGTDGHSRPIHSLRPVSGNCLSPSRPVHWSQSSPEGFASPLCWVQRREEATSRFPPTASWVLLCHGAGLNHLGASWVLQVPPYGTNQQLLQPAGRLGHAGGAGERCCAGRGAPAVPVGFGGAVGPRTFSLFSAHRVWRPLGSATGLTVPSCARGCVTWGLSSL